MMILNTTYGGARGRPEGEIFFAEGLLTGFGGPRGLR